MAHLAKLPSSWLRWRKPWRPPGDVPFLLGGILTVSGDSVITFSGEKKPELREMCSLQREAAAFSWGNVSFWNCTPFSLGSVHLLRHAQLPVLETSGDLHFPSFLISEMPLCEEQKFNLLHLMSQWFCCHFVPGHLLTAISFLPRGA